MARIFVTGATGFIGTRLVEMALARGHEPVCLVRDWARASRLARMPVRMVEGDVMKPAVLAAAMAGCERVFHCAVDHRLGGRAHRRSSRVGTDHVMAAAQRVGVSRVVHLSSAAVHGYTPAADIDLDTEPAANIGDPYCDGKIDAERVALRYHRSCGLAVAIVRPTLVYGPFSPLVAAIAALHRRRRLVLVDGGAGVCNSLYVDNLIDAMLLASERETAVGQILHINDAQPLRWREFIEALVEGLTPGASLPVMTRAEISRVRDAARSTRPSSLAAVAALVRHRDVRRLVRAIPAVEQVVGIGRRLLPEAVKARIRSKRARMSGGDHAATPPPAALEDFEVDMLSTFQHATFSIEKARVALGYQPNVSVRDGLARSVAWMQWARL